MTTNMNSHSTMWLFLLIAITPPCVAAERPNFFFCIADDGSFAHFGANGCTCVNTPNIVRIAREGINFTSAYTPNPKWGPSGSVLIMGRNPWQLGAAVIEQVPPVPQGSRESSIRPIYPDWPLVK